MTRPLAPHRFVDWMHVEITRRHEHQDLDGLAALAHGLWNIARDNPNPTAIRALLRHHPDSDHALTLLMLATLVARLDKARDIVAEANQHGADHARRTAHLQLTGLLASSELEAARQHLQEKNDG